MRYPKVKQNKKQKITKSDVIKMKKLKKDGLSQKEIAKIFNVHTSTIYCYTSPKFDRAKHNKLSTENNKKRYKTDKEFRTRMKAQITKNNAIRIKKDKQYKKYKLETCRNLNQKFRDMRHDEIGKMAVTLHVYMDEIQRNIHENKHHLSSRQMKLVWKLARKFLNYMKKTDYYYLSNKRWGENYYQNIKDHINVDEDSTAVQLTWLQYQLHSFIREVFPYFMGDGFHRVANYTKFYKQTLQKLMR